MLLKLHFKERALERKKLRAAAKAIHSVLLGGGGKTGQANVWFRKRGN